MYIKGAKNSAALNWYCNSVSDEDRTASLQQEKENNLCMDARLTLNYYIKITFKKCRDYIKTVIKKQKQMQILLLLNYKKL